MDLLSELSTSHGIHFISSGPCHYTQHQHDESNMCFLVVPLHSCLYVAFIEAEYIFFSPWYRWAFMIQQRQLQIFIQKHTIYTLDLSGSGGRFVAQEAWRAVRLLSSVHVFTQSHTNQHQVTAMEGINCMWPTFVATAINPWFRGKYHWTTNVCHGAQAHQFLFATSWLGVIIILRSCYVSKIYQYNSDSVTLWSDRSLRGIWRFFWSGSGTAVLVVR